MAAGGVEESSSPFCHNMVFVTKDGSLGLCQDFRPTNQKCKDSYSYSIPRIESLKDCLKGANNFASLDLFSGYHQVGVHGQH